MNPDYTAEVGKAPVLRISFKDGVKVATPLARSRLAKYQIKSAADKYCGFPNMQQFDNKSRYSVVASS